MIRQKKKNKIMGLWATALLSFFTRKKRPITTGDLKRSEFKTSAKNIGITFNEKIRNIFRPTWLKKHSNKHQP